MSLPTCQTCVYAKGICKKTGVEIRPTTGCTYHTPKPITNADLIRSMTVEELADMLVDIGECDRRCPAKLDDCIFSDSSCRSAWLDWLKEETDNG